MDKKEYFKLAGDEFSNKYGENNPYYKSEESFITKLSEKEKEINDRINKHNNELDVILGHIPNDYHDDMGTLQRTKI